MLNGPTATGQHCPEGWTLYPAPGPQMKGVTDPGSADFHYYNWVDQFDTSGLGENIPIATGSGSDSLLALLPDTGEWVILRVPYPLGFLPAGSTGASTMQKPAGKVEACGRITGHTTTGISKGARAPRARLSIFSSDPILSPTEWRRSVPKLSRKTKAIIIRDLLHLNQEERMFSAGISLRFLEGVAARSVRDGVPQDPPSRFWICPSQ